MSQATLILVGACATSEGVLAVEWNSSSNIALGVAHTDNLFFTDSNKVSDTNLLFVPAFELRGESSTDRSILGAGVNIERYKTTKEADRDDPFAHLDWEHDWEQNSLGLGLHYSEVSTGTSELEATGRVNIYGTRTNKSVTPRWESILDEKNTLVLNLGLLDVSYDLPTYTDYRDYSLRISWSHHASPRRTQYLNVMGHSYDGDVVGLDYDYAGLIAGVRYLASEQFTYDLSLGAGYAMPEIGENNTTWLVNASLTSEREYDNTTLTFSSELMPTSQGELREVYALGLGYRREMLPLLNFTFNARFSKSLPVESSGLARNENLSIQPGFSFQLGEEWILRAWYEYRKNQYMGSEATTANSYYFGIRYQSDGGLG